jgi:hypothetical protein
MNIAFAWRMTTNDSARRHKGQTCIERERKGRRGQDNRKVW